MDVVELTDDEFTRFQGFIYRMTGIRVPDTKRTLLSSRIRRCVRRTGCDGFGAYFRQLTGPAGRQEIGAFLDAITTNETFFYRTRQHFEWFRREFIPEMVRRGRRGERPKKLSIWSAACSTGEEAYTLAMCLAANRLQLRDWTLEVVGTDLSSDAIEQARQAIYSQRSVEGVDPHLLRRYFTRISDKPSWQVRPELREMVEFRQHNLIEPFRREAFDCVFLRNVLIYFDVASKAKVLANLRASMAEGAYLVVGPNEGVFEMLDSLERCNTFLYQKKPSAGC